MAWPKHVRRYRRTSITEDDWTEEDRGYSSPCWIFNKVLSGNGYANVKMCQKQIKAHRWMYEHHVGPIPAGLHLDHLCRQPACLRPDHLEPVTVGENLRRGANARLTREQVEEIRLIPRAVTHYAVAERYGLSYSHTCRIRNGKHWTG
jgi:hypothetical protein